MFHFVKYRLSYCSRFVSQFVIFSVSKLCISKKTDTEGFPHYIDKQRGTIIVSNHANSLDPFAIISSIPYRSFFRLAPFAFMTANIFYRPLWLRPFAFLAGCFPAHEIKPNGPLFGVDAAVYFLNHRCTLVMFPEGKRTQGTRLPAKRGISSILEKVPDVQLLVAKISWRKNTVNKIKFARYSGSSNQGEAILDAIYDL